MIMLQGSIVRPSGTPAVAVGDRRERRRKDGLGIGSLLDDVL